MEKSRIKELVLDEIAQGGYPFPPSLIHAIIKVESNWTPGIVNASSGATGLMQVMPIVVSDFNKANGTSIAMTDLQTSSDYSTRLQIRVGLWVLGIFWRSAYKYLSPKIGNVPIDELVKIADMFYVAGPGAARKKLDQLATPTSAGVMERWPEWSALNHVKKIWGLVDTDIANWDLEKIDEWLDKSSQHKPSIAGIEGNLGGFLVGAIILLIGWNMLADKKGKK